MAEQTIAAPQHTEGAMTRQEGTRALERYTTPAVDIYETAEGLVVLADVPGVWVANRLNDTVVRVDPNNDRPGAPIPVGSKP